jgi:PAS domain S-box-containing protein
VGTGRKNILLVEDEALIALSEKSSLERYGYDVVTVDTGEKAVALIDDEHSFDLILMDINLGRGIDGTEAAARILARQELPVLFLSSHTDPEIVEKTEKITSYGYVVKSSSITVLDASIKMAFKLFDAYKKSKELNNRLEATFNALPDLLFEVGLDGMYFDVRSTDEELLYKPLPDLLGKRIPEVLPPDIAAIIMEAIEEAAERGKSFGRQYELPVPLGRCWFEIAVSRIISPGEDPHFILMCRNISDRKQVEESLREERQRLAGIIEGTNIGTWEWNVDTGETSFNERWAEIVGYTLEELSPISINTWAGLAHPEDLKISQSLLERHFGGELPYYECESRMRHKQGHWVWVLDRGKLSSRTPEGKPLLMLGTHQDITERKRLEQALRVNEERYKKAELVAHLGSWEYSIASNTFWGSDEAKRIYGLGTDSGGFAADEVMACVIERDRVEQAMKDLIERGKPYDIVFDIVARGSTERKTINSVAELIRDAEGKPVKVTGVLQEITRLRRLERALSQRKTLLGQAEKLGRIGAWVLNVDTRKQDWSEETFRVLDLDPAAGDHALEDLFNFIQPAYRAALASALEAVELRGESMNGEWEIITPTGKKRWIHMVASPHREGGRISHILGSLRDITADKLAELQIKSLLADKELILKEVHHRIKNNMYTIGSLLSLQAATIAEPAAIAALEDARGRVQSMMVLYEKLYQAQDYGELTLERYLSPLVDEIVGNFSRGGTIRVEKQFDATALDMKRLQAIGIIVNELITNVMKYAFVGGRAGRISVNAGRVADHIELSVGDDGVGIPEGVNFEDSGGFGLMLINTLTKQLNGTIRIERGAGTRVVLSIGL